MCLVQPDPEKMARVQLHPVSVYSQIKKAHAHVQQVNTFSQSQHSAAAFNRRLVWRCPCRRLHHVVQHELRFSRVTIIILRTHITCVLSKSHVIYRASIPPKSAYKNPLRDLPFHWKSIRAPTSSHTRRVSY
jgi:hypothetical protein